MYDKKANHVAKMLELSEQHIAAQHDEERKQKQRKAELKKKWDTIHDKRETERRERRERQERKQQQENERIAREAERWYICFTRL